MVATVAHVDAVRGSALNERELWREMVRWSGGRIVEERGVLLVSGPSSYLRVASRSDPLVDGGTAVAQAIEFFADEPTGFIVLVRRPDDEDIERAALAAGFRAGWTERPMAIYDPPSPGAIPDAVEVRMVADATAVVDLGRVVALANDDPGERERAPLLFHDETIVAPHIAAFVTYLDTEPVACAMTLVSHRVAGVSTSRRGARPQTRARRHAHAPGRARRVRDGRQRRVARGLRDGRRRVPPHRIPRPRHNPPRTRTANQREHLSAL